MRNFRKAIAVLVALTMLLCVVTLTASAGEAPYVVLKGRTQMENQDIYEADLFISGVDAGGAQGTITYDTAAFDFEEVVFTGEFAAANKGTDSAVKVDETNGTIAFIGINPGNDVVWFTLKFKAVGLTDGSEFAVGDGVLKLVSAKVDGKEAFVETFVDTPEVQVVTPDQVDINGATIKATATVGKQDIRFEATVDYKEDLTITEYGVIFLPSQLLNGYELVADPDFDYNPDETKVTKAAIASTNEIEEDNTDQPTKLYATLTGSASFNASALAQVDISARAYIKLSDGSVEYIDILYSNNDEETTYIDNGYAKKSIIGVAKTMANYVITQDGVVYTDAVVDADAVNAIIETEVLTSDQQTALLGFVKANVAIIEARQAN